MNVLKYYDHEVKFEQLSKGDTFCFETDVYIKTSVNCQQIAIQLNGRRAGVFNNSIVSGSVVLPRSYSLVRLS